ncbi:hypothetical protein BFX83_02725 [Komagataeibacter xylinus]|nr:hypothetical protein BFX83_02725 [Komagataeibacter xylinus]
MMAIALSTISLDTILRRPDLRALDSGMRSVIWLPGKEIWIISSLVPAISSTPIRSTRPTPCAA